MPEIENKVTLADHEGSDTVAVARFRTRKTASEYGLVILSMKLPYWLDECEDGGYEIRVERSYSREVLTQLKKYEGESRKWSQKLLGNLPAYKPVSIGGVFAAGIFLCLLFVHSSGQRELVFYRGIMDSLAVVGGGEWWRVVTSLTLHNDLGHLVANVVFGGLFVYFLLTILGNGLGWFVTLLSGIVGNILLATSYYPDLHRSVGASTAIFGVLGALVGSELCRVFSQRSISIRKSVVLVPLMAGLGFLGLFGVGGSNTDIMAHLWGFAAGIPIGVLASFVSRKPFISGRGPQLFLSGMSVGIVALAWVLAISSG